MLLEASRIAIETLPVWHRKVAHIEGRLGDLLLTREEYPMMDPALDQLLMELVTMPFDKQNEIWNALRTTYLPSVLYRVRMVVFHDETPNVVTGITGIEAEANPNLN